MVTKTRARHTGILWALVAIPMLLAVTACETVPANLTTPGGFAEYSATEKAYRAITPEGVVLRVRSVANEPAQSLKFWSEALEVQLTKSGYILLEKATFSSPAGAGIAFEWNAPFNGEDWVYLTAIAVSADKITIAEAAGEHEHYQDYRQSIVESLSSIVPESE